MLRLTHGSSTADALVWQFGSPKPSHSDDLENPEHQYLTRCPHLRSPHNFHHTFLDQMCKLPFGVTSQCANV